MNNDKFLTCILLCCSSNIDKGFSVLNAIKSVLNQNCSNFELVIVENSRSRHEGYMDKVKTFTNDTNSQRDKPINIKWVINKKQLSRGEARNRGVKKATGDLLIFLEDDTIVLNPDSFSTIYKKSQGYRYGYGARRLWVDSLWFKKNANQLLDMSYRDEAKTLKQNAGSAASSSRHNQFDDLLNKTFITNLGFCRQDDFQTIGGFPDFQGYGFEDDYLMYRLFVLSDQVYLMDDLAVAHIDHGIELSAHRTLIPYFQLLNKDNVYWFHVGKILNHGKTSRTEIIEKLNTLHYDYEIEDAYKLYIKKSPFNLIAMGDNSDELKFWRKKYQFNIKEFARQIHVLSKSQDVDEYIQNSEADFDNLGPVIEAATESELVLINSEGRIVTQKEFVFTQPYSNELISVDEKNFIPDSTLNQFPCDKRSIRRRHNLLKDRYPYAEYLKLGIIGDDDFLSLELVNDYWIDAIIVEKDNRIIDKIGEYADRFNLINHDVCEPEKLTDIPKVESFITDPPYTLHGALAFIFTGVSMLENSNDWPNEFYVILNRTMMGDHLDNLLAILSSSGINLKYVHRNFNQYLLPDNFEEAHRAKDFMNKTGREPSKIHYSSSSNLYIFESNNPDTSSLFKAINYNKIYEHYSCQK